MSQMREPEHGFREALVAIAAGLLFGYLLVWIGKWIGMLFI
jgi:hypothetical protein